MPEPHARGQRHSGHASSVDQDPIDKGSLHKDLGSGASEATLPERAVMTKLKFDVAHQVPGRVRMKIPSAKGNPELLKQVAETFAAIPGIENVTVNPATGSVVLHYDTERHDEFHGHFSHHVDGGYRPPATDIDQMAQRIEEEAEFLAQHSDSARAVVDFFKKVDREIRTATDNTIDLKIALALGIIGFTVMEVGTAAATPVWVTLTLFALNHVIEMHSVHQDQERTTAPVIVKS
jgi:Heavy metal associated domain 2